MSKDIYIHPTAIVEEGAIIGEGTKIWHHCHIRSSAIIGSNCNLGKNVYVDSNVKVGSGVKIQNNVSLYAGLTIEDDVFIGPSVVFTNDLNPRAFSDWNSSQASITLVKKGASLGANSSILCGNTIGEYAMIAMGSVIINNIGQYELWAGNPAIFKGKVDKNGYKISI